MICGDLALSQKDAFEWRPNRLLPFDLRDEGAEARDGGADLREAVRRLRALIELGRMAFSMDRENSE